MFKICTLFAPFHDNIASFMNVQMLKSYNSTLKVESQKEIIINDSFLLIMSLTHLEEENDNK